MNTVSSFLPSSSPTRSSTENKIPTAFEINSNEFGEAGAALIGAAATAVDAVSTTVSLSAEGLKRLGSSASSAVDSIEAAVNGFSSEFSEVTQGMSDELKKAYGVVEKSLASAVSGAEEAVTAAEHSISSAADSVADGASSLEDGVSSMVNKAVGYISVGLSALA